MIGRRSPRRPRLEGVGARALRAASRRRTDSSRTGIDRAVLDSAAPGAGAASSRPPAGSRLLGDHVVFLQ